MRLESRTFYGLTIFFFLTTIVYWFLSEDPSGTTILTLATLMSALLWFYLSFTSRHTSPRPEDSKTGDIAEGAREMGFFSPYSWWPLWMGLGVSLGMVGIAVGWWLLYFAAPIAAIGVLGTVFEYYSGQHDRYTDEQYETRDSQS
jgi:hypothetical protein